MDLVHPSTDAAPAGRARERVLADAEIARAVAARFPGARVLEVRALAADNDLAHDDTHKAAGYGAPRKVRLLVDGEERALVFHLQKADPFGHDRPSDRACAQLLAFDTFHRLPRHARALDVGAIDASGRLISLATAGEHYLVTEWVDGAPYADDLRRLAQRRSPVALDVARADALCDYLVALHAHHQDDPMVYRRAIRDLVGHGEGIFGMIDAYPPSAPGAPPARLQAIERACVDWRWRLRGREARLTTTHGDFHPFNIVFSEGERFTLLDASRGSRGDAADDVAALCINYVFFALDHPGAWAEGFRTLWRRFFQRYLSRSGDEELLEVLAPFLAWRGLVVASPAFYPDLPGASRDRLLAFVETALHAERFDPAFADRVFA